MSERSEIMSAATGKRLVYLFGIGGNPELSPAMKALEADGWEIIVPDLPGFNGRPGFVAPSSYIDWLTVLWDALDATGALPCPVIGASLGGMLAAELAAFRPEAVTKLALLAPFGTTDGDDPGLDLYAIPAAERMARLFAKGLPDAFADRFGELGTEEGPVARYLSDVAAANLLWPFGERGLANRIHRITANRVTLWGDLDELRPVGTSGRWGDVEVIAGAGHLLEWDVPDEVTERLRAFLAD